MVQLAITSRGLEDAMRLASEKKASVCGGEAVSEAEYQTRSYPGLSRFIYPLQGANAVPIARAMDTIEEHHPRTSPRFLPTRSARAASAVPQDFIVPGFVVEDGVEVLEPCS